MSEGRRHSERSEEPGRAGGAPSAQPDPSLTLGMTAQIGVIGGSGLYEMEGLRVIEERNVATPFGEPRDSGFTTSKLIAPAPTG